MFITKQIHSQEELSITPEAHKIRQGSLWHPIPHWSVLESLRKSATHKGWAFPNQDFLTHLDKKGKEFVCSNLVIPVPCYYQQTPPQGMQWCIGAQNSHSSSCTIKLLAGVKLYSNNEALCLWQRSVGRHTEKLANNLEAKIQEAFQAWEDSLESFHVNISRLDSAYVSCDDRDKFLTSAGRMKLLPWSHLGDVDNLFSNTNKQSMWTFLQCFSKILRKRSPFFQVRGTWKLYKYFLSNLDSVG